MSQSWLVTVEDQAYGPYSLDQMRTFITEGRIVASSQVASPGAQQSHYADDDPVLGPMFGPAQPAQREAPDDALKPAQGFGRQPQGDDGVLNHIVILADIKSRSLNEFEETVFNMGRVAPIMPQAWLLTTTHSLNAVRNVLVQTLGTVDTLFVVDATHDRAAWFNFGPEADSRMRRLWNRTPAAKSA
jgi:hypothetical protein